MRIKRQIDQQDCGLCVVESLHNFFFDSSLSLDHLRQNSMMTPQGLSIQSLIDLGQEYGVILEAFEAPFSAIEKNINEKMIAIINNNGMSHYIIFEKQKDGYLLYDSSQGKSKVTKDAFAKMYQGMVLTAEKGTWIKPSLGHDQTIKIWKLLFKKIDFIIWINICLLLGVIFSFSSTLFAKITFDYVLPKQLPKTLQWLVIGFGFMALLRVLNHNLKTYLIRKLEIIIEWDLLNLFLIKMRHCDLAQLQKITTSDLLRRMFLIEPSATFAATGLFLLINELMVITIATTMLIWLSTLLFTITLVCGVIVIATTFCFQWVLKEGYEETINLHTKKFEVQNMIPQQLQEIREEKKWLYLKNKFENTWLQNKRREISIWKICTWQSMIIEAINYIAPIVLTYFAVNLIFQKQISIGTMMLFLGMFSMFLSPLIQLCNFLIKFNLNAKYAGQVMHIINLPINMNNANGMKLQQLQSISINKLEFKFDKPLIKIDHWQIDHSICLSGSNGVGKSTFLRLLAQRYKSEGISFNDLDIGYYNNEVLSEEIYLNTLQEKFTADSIINQITFANKKAIQRFTSNIEKYNLIPMLEKIGINLYNSPTAGDRQLSSGQEQIIKLMRLFAFEYKLILLDEALENVDHDSFTILASTIPLVNPKALYIEVSHAQRYLLSSPEVNFEKVNAHQ